MNILITGSSSGIGRTTALKFLAEGHDVAGIDILPPTITDCKFTAYKADVSEPDSLPPIPDIEVLVNNAGIQSGREMDIMTNLLGVIYCTEAYGLQPKIKSICNVASASAHSGAEFPMYAASKGGVLAYTKHIAMQIAKWDATCNSISPGGVTTALNAPVMDDPEKWAEIMNETPLKKWAEPEEIADWIYFMTVQNKSMTAQDILVDNGEIARSNFVW